MAEGSIVRSTLRALLVPQRLLPIVLVSAPLVIAQRSFSRDPFAAPLGILMCVVFVLVAPVSFRVLFPEGLEFEHGAIRVLLYAAIGLGVVLSLGLFLPTMLRIGPTFLTTPTSLVISTTLFLVGGWGLGRDVGFEASLERERARGRMLEREAERAELLALRAHLDPHFLFNTLNAIAEHCRDDGEVAERAVLELAEILRAVLAGVRAPSWPLAKEVELATSLVSLHRMRDPGRFEVSIDVALDLPAAEVPPMVLLPLVDNAIKHGADAGHRGKLVLAVAARGQRLHITVESPGAYGGPRVGSEGLPTLERRLALAYDGAARFTIEGAGERTIATLDLPLATSPGASA